MPRSSSIPKYCLHKPSGRAYVCIHGKVVYIGDYGTPKSKREYARLIAELSTSEGFADLQEKRVNLVSLKDGLDLSTAAGRLMAHVLASVAQFETEVRAERILAGQQAARAAGKVWGGGKAGRRVTLTEEKEKAIRQLHKQGESIAKIARVVELSRPTVYKVLG